MKIINTLSEGIKSLLKPFDTITDDSRINLALKVTACALTTLLFVAIVPKVVVYATVFALGAAALIDNRKSIMNYFNKQFA
jgi:hypothetical protein